MGIRSSGIATASAVGISEYVVDQHVMKNLHSLAGLHVMMGLERHVLSMSPTSGEESRQLLQSRSSPPGHAEAF